jgi:hypothetical protein
MGGTSIMEQRKFPWLIVLIGVGCLSLVCICVVAAGAILYFRQERNSSLLPENSTSELARPSATIPPQDSSPRPTAEKSPTERSASPIEEEPLPVQELTGNQRSEANSFFDDYSSEALRWPIFDDGTTILKYENEAYSFQVTDADFFDWAYLPVTFSPREIQFDVIGEPGQQDGSFGVFCQFIDIDNHYYVEFDLGEKNFIIGQYFQGEEIVLSGENSQSGFWQNAPAFQSPSAINHISIGCYPDIITLFINEEWVAEANVLEQIDNQGEMAFFVYAFDIAGEKGYKVTFDNVEAWLPIQ